jgi:hypothetical protein
MHATMHATGKLQKFRNNNKKKHANKQTTVAIQKDKRETKMKQQ